MHLRISWIRFWCLVPCLWYRRFCWLCWLGLLRLRLVSIRRGRDEWILVRMLNWLLIAKGRPIGLTFWQLFLLLVIDNKDNLNIINFTTYTHFYNLIIKNDDHFTLVPSIWYFIGIIYLCLVFMRMILDFIITTGNKRSQILQNHSFKYVRY